MFHFVVDSEAHDITVTPALAQRIGLHPDGVRFGGYFHGIFRDQVAYASIPPLQIGGARWLGAKAEIVDLDALSRQLCQPIDGILALDALDIPFEIDYAAGVLHLASSVDQFRVRLGGHELDPLTEVAGASVQIATTYRGALEFGQQHLARLGIADAELVDDPELQAFAWPADRRLVPRFPSPGPAPVGLDFHGVDTRVSHLGWDLRLGYEVLRTFTVRYDGSHTWLYPNGAALPRDLVSFGLTWDLDGGEARVTGVTRSTKALGVLWGARILAVDDFVIADLDLQSRCLLHRDWEQGRDRVRLTLDTEQWRRPDERLANPTPLPNIVVEVPRRSIFNEPRAP